MLKCKYILYLEGKGKQKNLPKKSLGILPTESLFLIYTHSCMLNTAFSKEPRSGLLTKSHFHHSNLLCNAVAKEGNTGPCSWIEFIFWQLIREHLFLDAVAIKATHVSKQ